MRWDFNFLSGKKTGQMQHWQIIHSFNLGIRATLISLKCCAFISSSELNCFCAKWRARSLFLSKTEEAAARCSSTRLKSQPLRCPRPMGKSHTPLGFLFTAAMWIEATSRCRTTFPPQEMLNKLRAQYWQATSEKPVWHSIHFWRMFVHHKF